MTDKAIEAAVDAMWDEFCPGIRQTPQEREDCRFAVIAAIAAYEAARGDDELAKRLLDAAGMFSIQAYSYGMTRAENDGFAADLRTAASRLSVKGGGE